MERYHWYAPARNWGIYLIFDDHFCRGGSHEGKGGRAVFCKNCVVGYGCTHWNYREEEGGGRQSGMVIFADRLGCRRDGARWGYPSILHKAPKPRHPIYKILKRRRNTPYFPPIYFVIFRLSLEIVPKHRESLSPRPKMAIFYHPNPAPPVAKCAKNAETEKGPHLRIP